MFFHKSILLAIEALKYIVKKNSNDYIGVMEIAEATASSKTFMSKVLQKLVSAGILNSKTGPNSGYKLAVKPTEISLMEIVRIFDNEKILYECFLGMPECSDENPCVLHYQYEKFRTDIIESLLQKTVKDLGKSK